MSEFLTDDLLKRAEAGEPAALDALERMSGDSHDADCTYRCKGECDCRKSVINAILEAHGREVN